MSVALRVLDDGAWISVDDRRRVSVSELWRLPGSAFCDCRVPDLVVEGFLETGVDGRTVETRVAGQCIACGESGTTDWLPVGRILDGEFHDLAREGGVFAREEGVLAREGGALAREEGAFGR